MKLSTWIIPKIQDILFITILIMALVLGPRMLNMDGDLPRHLLMGKFITQNGEIPTTEPFIYPYLGKPYVSHEWLSDVILYLIYRYAGLAGIALLSSILLASTFTILLKELTLTTRLYMPVFFLVIAGAGITSLNWATRPHLITMLLLTIWIIWSNRLMRGEKTPLWKFPALMFLWANLHGEFIAGILTLLAYAAGWTWDYLTDRQTVNFEQGKNIGIVLTTSLFASFLNPAGIGPWTSIFGFLNNSYLMSRMAEANAPNLQTPEMRPLLLLLTLSIFLLAIKKEKLQAGQGILLAGFSAMSLLAIRNVHLYGIVAPFVLAETLKGFNNIPIIKHIEGIIQKFENQLKGSVWPIVVTTSLGALILISKTAQSVYQLSPDFFPVSAITWLNKNPQEGNMFNELDWGGYIGFYLWPKQMAFVDSVADVTGDVTMQYETMITSTGNWQELLSQHEIQWVIIAPDSALAKSLKGSGWKILYQDEKATILRKK